MKKKMLFILVFILLLSIYLCFQFIFPFPKKTYTMEDFAISPIVSPVDYNQNGVDDYTDIVQGAILEGKKQPHYKSVYYAGGYPPDGEGVCTDLIWRSLAYAGYDLKSLVDQDILEHPERYTRIEKPDPNIDFRRVYNLHVFFEYNTLSLTTDLSKIEEFQPGDILVFKNDKHIGIVSNKRNKKGVPYLLHHTGSIKNHFASLEEDILSSYTIIGHYRFALKNK